jgi:hypothetical protein
MMNHHPIRLITSSGSQSVDDALCGLIGSFETRFPGRIRAYHVEGRRAAAWLLGQILYDDQAIIHALQEPATSAPQENLL